MLQPIQDLSSFSLDYATARAQFLNRLDRADGAFGLHSFAHPLAGPAGEALACDVASLGIGASCEALLLVLCGTHGVEGLAGSAVLCDLMEPLRTLQAGQPGLGVMLVHGLNPWGMAWLRRGDADNVDLNRNFVDFSAALPRNPAYEQAHRRLLDGATPAAAELDALSTGQYSHADGLFYGGREPSWSRRTVEALGAWPVFDQLGRVAVIDLHTGLGPFGYGEVINDHAPGSAGDALARAWFGPNAASTAEGQSFSVPKPGLMDYFWHQRLGDRGCCVTLEFGTQPMAAMLDRLIDEQRYANACAERGQSRDITHPSVRALRELFYPAHPSWQAQVLWRSRQVVDMALQGLRA